MNNNEILKMRWKDIDKEINKFMKKNNHTINNLFDNLDDILKNINFSYYEALYKYATLDEVARLKREIKKLKDDYKLSTYENYLLNSIDKIKIKKSEWLKGMILIAYLKQYKVQESNEKEFFDEICNIMYQQGQIEAYEVLNKKEKEPRLLTIPEAFALQLLGTSCFNGFKWYDYKQGKMKNNADILYTNVIQELQAGREISTKNEKIKNILLKQQNQYIAKKKEINVNDKDYYSSDFIGSLDSVVSLLANQAYLRGLLLLGIKKCKFIAVLDNHTTEMCKSLDGQIFDLEGINKFDRYSDYDKKNVVYTVKGMETGANLPPINNHFHYCRSTIIAYK